MKIILESELPGDLLGKLTRLGHEVTVVDQGLGQSDFIKLASKAEVIVCLLSRSINSAALESLPALRLICNYAVGFNNLDIDAIKSRSIWATNTPDVLTEATAELGLALLMSISRNLKTANASVHKGEWKNWSATGFLGTSFRGKKLGIIGAGRIGQSFARKVYYALGAEVLYQGPSSKKELEQEIGAKKVDMPELLENSDIISLHCPLSDETRGLAGPDFFKQLKKRPYFINTARGGLHCEDALYKALINGTLRAAGLDVTETEPLSPGSPLLELENCFITPHIGSATLEARTAMSELCLRSIQEYTKGERPKKNIY